MSFNQGWENGTNGQTTNIPDDANTPHNWDIITLANVDPSDISAVLVNGAYMYSDTGNATTLCVAENSVTGDVVEFVNKTVEMTAISFRWCFPAGGGGPGAYDIILLDDMDVEQDRIANVGGDYTEGTESPYVNFYETESFNPSKTGTKIRFERKGLESVGSTFMVDNISYSEAGAGGGGDPHVFTLKGEDFAIHKY